MNGNKFGTWLTGFIVGGLIAAVATLLTTPQSGEETRALIRDRSVDIKNRASEKAGQTRTRANEIFSTTRDWMQDQASMALDRATTLVNETNEKVERISSKVEDKLPKEAM
ncbi:MAG: YtxH domain-containing protein [Chloroflexi bacterium]|jgi:gas vesicle protein|nr:YtxH domain-containing protein [Anaerolineaceae bacterium]NMB86741.1 YtxH domain-containing protein [Chloroflexota bacterium]